jgi:hypothetical protein
MGFTFRLKVGYKKIGNTMGFSDGHRVLMPAQKGFI